MSDTRAVERSATSQQTFEEFFVVAWPEAYRIAAFLVHDPSIGEDIAQDVLASMYRTWGHADNPHAYLRGALVNAANNWHRKTKVRHNKLPLVAQSETVDFVFDELSDAVAALPFRQRAVIVLRYHAGLREAEIADALGCRPGTVKSLSSRALKQLSKEITR